jgi:hypothetical protein
LLSFESKDIKKLSFDQLPLRNLMDSASRSGTQSSEDQFEKRSDKPDSKINKPLMDRLKSIPARLRNGDPSSTGNPSNLAVLGTEIAPGMPDDDEGIQQQPNHLFFATNTESATAKDEMLNTLPPTSVSRQELRTWAEGKPSPFPISNMFADPPSLPLETHGLISTNDGNSISMGPDQALIDWRAQMLLLAQQNEEKLAIAKEFQRTLALQAITSLPEKLDIAHQSVKDWLGTLTLYLRSIEGFTERHEETIRKKAVEITALKDKYDDLIRMTPEAHQDDLRQIKDKVIVAMQQDMEVLREKGEEARKEVEGKNGNKVEVDRTLERTRELVPVLVGDLIKLEQKLSDM